VSARFKSPIWRGCAIIFRALLLSNRRSHFRIYKFLETRIHCAGEGHQQFTRPADCIHRYIEVGTHTDRVCSCVCVSLLETRLNHTKLHSKRCYRHIRPPFYRVLCYGSLRNQSALRRDESALFLRCVVAQLFLTFELEWLEHSSKQVKVG
jgi:hypothetical protein